MFTGQTKLFSMMELPLSVSQVVKYVAKLLTYLCVVVKP